MTFPISSLTVPRTVLNHFAIHAHSIRHFLTFYAVLICHNWNSTGSDAAIKRSHDGLKRKYFSWERNERLRNVCQVKNLRKEWKEALTDSDVVGWVNFLQTFIDRRKYFVSAKIFTEKIYFSNIYLREDFFFMTILNLENPDYFLSTLVK